MKLVMKRSVAICFADPRAESECRACVELDVDGGAENSQRNQQWIVDEMIYPTDGAKCVGDLC